MIEVVRARSSRGSPNAAIGASVSTREAAGALLDQLGHAE
jgi:hypothetical protein